jgi:hypothetical protein
MVWPAEFVASPPLVEDAPVWEAVAEEEVVTLTRVGF